MITDRHMALCECIREQCRALQYYGPDGGWMDYRGYFDADGKLQVRVITHDPHSGFEFPPASEEQLQATEEALGIPLPPMLRALYAQVANGGFGPACGITGASGGYYFGEDGRYETVDMCTYSDPTVHYLDLREYERAHGDPVYFELQQTIQPAHFFHLCYKGCGMDDYVDGISGRVYQAAWCRSLPDHFVPNKVLPGKWVPEGVIGFWRVADSLEEWLERWLRGEVQDPFASDTTGTENQEEFPF